MFNHLETEQSTNVSGVRFKPWWFVAVLLFLYDLGTVAASYYLALALRFERWGNFPKFYGDGFVFTAQTLPILCVLVYLFLRLYNSIWKLAGHYELMHCLEGVMITTPIHVGLLYYTYGRMPVSYYAYGGVLQLAFLLASRFGVRICFREVMSWKRRHSGFARPRRAMLIGAGSAGQAVLREFSLSRQTRVAVRCIIDDDANKWGRRLDDIPIVGGRDAIVPCAKKFHVQQIFLAIPSASPETKHAILSKCQETGCGVKLLPGLYELTKSEFMIGNMRNVEIEDLLQQPPVEVNQGEIAQSLAGRRVLVTGGGGSVGSELCRQIAACGPKQLVLFDIYENIAYCLQQDLQGQYPSLDVVVKVGSVCDAAAVSQLFASCRPEIVFHAAGHKHVPLMEESPREAIVNNVLGTYVTACAALANGCQRFVLFSSDKAVNPISVMGVTSRICEMLMHALDHLARTGGLSKLFPPFDGSCSSAATRFAAIRFGNAFDSQGAVMTLFKTQIARGGPVLVTHKEATRFCMSLQNTVRLILQATCYAENGDVYVLDMGEPFRIDELARRLIRLSGYVPDQDIQVKYTGLRPGEKLYEQPLMQEEGMRKTSCSHILVATAPPMNYDEFLREVSELFASAESLASGAELRERLSAIVKSYHQEASNSAVYLASQLEHPPEPINVLEGIAKQFAIPGDVTAVVPLVSGYINRTYRVDTVQPSGEVGHFLLQRINTKVFPDPDALMENFANVTAHLSGEFRLSGRAGAACPTLILTRNGKNFLSVRSGAWRMMSFFEDIHSYDIPENPEVFYHSGVAFGAFLQAMSSFPPAKIHEVIPNFHNTWSRYQDLEKAIAADPVGRVAEVRREIDFVRARRELFRKISEPLQAGELPLRIGHNDCNLNNILFDNRTNLPVAIVDLDTVMPSSPLYDFGDSMRIGTNTARDDEKDLSKVSCDLNLYEHYARGWLQSCGKMLTARERELLPYAALVITSEDGIRFLMDHINGDTYYYIYYLGQNLDRARTQFKLLEDMEKKLPEIQAILDKLYEKFC